MTKSSITNTDCAFYEVEIEERRGGRNPHWVTLKKMTSPQPFEVQDETSRIGVQPEGASLVIKNDFQKSPGLFTPLDPPILEAVERLGVETTGALKMRKTLRVTERRIEPGEDIFVLGQIKMVEGRRQIAAIDRDSLIIADRGEQPLLHSLYIRVALLLVLIPAGFVLVGWLVLRSW